MRNTIQLQHGKSKEAVYLSFLSGVLLGATSAVAASQNRYRPGCWP